MRRAISVATAAAAVIAGVIGPGIVGAVAASADDSISAANPKSHHVEEFVAERMPTRFYTGKDHDAHPKTAGKAKPGSVPQNGIQYHGGPVMTGQKNVYLIWYGDWTGSAAAPSSNPAAKALIESAASSIGGSPYFNINTTYMNGSLARVQNAVALTGETTDSYSQGKTLTDAGVQAVVSAAITSHRLTLDTNGVYFVLTSGDVGESSGFLTQYCGWHTNGSISGADVKYAFIGDPAKNTAACSQQTPGPNGTAVGNADAMVSIISHELEEAATDPDLNAWYDRTGAENADKCAWKFGTTSTASNGKLYNMTLGGTQYLIQQNWVNASNGYCATSY